MKYSLLKFLACPYDYKSSLKMFEFDKEVDSKSQEIWIWEGILYCQQCTRWFPIINGIPRIMPDELRNLSEVEFLEKNKRKSSEIFNGLHILSSIFKEIPEPLDDTARLQRTEINVRDSEAAIYDDLKSEYENIIETKAVLERLNPQENDVILDLGAGTGRIARQYIKKCDELVACDFSVQSFEMFEVKMRKIGAANYHLVQADAAHLPFKSGVFDKVVSTQVLGYIPSGELRNEVLKKINFILKEEGSLIIDVFNYNFKIKLMNLLSLKKYERGKEGLQKGGVYYYRYTNKEFRNFLNNFFQVEEYVGILNTLPKITKLVGNSYKNLDRFIEKTIISPYLGTILLAKCTKINCQH